MLAPLAVVGSGVYIELALAVTVLVGLLQFATGALRLGSIANFISPTALLGFTGGAALLIAVHALKDALGVALPAGLHAAAVLQALAARIGDVHVGALLTAAVTAGSALALRRWSRAWPHMLIGVALGTAVAWAVNRGGGVAAGAGAGLARLTRAGLASAGAAHAATSRTAGHRRGTDGGWRWRSRSPSPRRWPAAPASASTATASSSARGWPTSSAACSLATSLAAP